MAEAALYPTALPLKLGSPTRLVHGQERKSKVWCCQLAAHSLHKGGIEGKASISLKKWWEESIVVFYLHYLMQHGSCVQDEGPGVLCASPCWQPAPALTDLIPQTRPYRSQGSAFLSPR